MSKKWTPVDDSIKEQYENSAKTNLDKTQYIVVRIDGRSFSRLMKDFQKPHDKYFQQAMNDTMMHLCRNILNCRIGYTQTDEITLILAPPTNKNSPVWLNYNVQKMCSAVASMATLEFNRAFQSATQQFRRQVNNCFTCTSQENDLVTAYEKVIKKGGGFDARVFSVPEQEVVNVLIWRQKYTIYNALRAAGRVYFFSQELQGKSDKKIRQMLARKGLNYDSLPSTFRLGACCIKTVIQNPDVDIKDGYYPKEKWILDTNVPVFSQNREYIKSALSAKEMNPCRYD